MPQVSSTGTTEVYLSLTRFFLEYSLMETVPSQAGKKLFDTEPKI